MNVVEKNKWFESTEQLIGKKGIQKLQQSHVLIAGLGGVGAYAAEMLCRAGIGTLTIIDGDHFSSTNRNRQIGALCSTEGMAKTEVMKNRLLDINPEITIYPICEYLKDEKLIKVFKLHSYSYIVDAIDTLSPKVFFIYHALQNKFKLVSAMGAGGKFDPSRIRVTDISESYECRLAYKLRKRLHALDITTGFDVVFSDEKVPRNVIIPIKSSPNKNSTVGTISYMPAIFGCTCASVVIRNILEKNT
jgi:tRNA threonylcarbamoyladenosine dehydratase